MLRHAEKPKAERRRHTRQPQRGRLYTVAACPDDLYPRGAQFNQEAVYGGLRYANWPAGTVFV
jgi:hypothetical protein